MPAPQKSFTACQNPVKLLNKNNTLEGSLQKSKLKGVVAFNGLTLRVSGLTVKL